MISEWTSVTIVMTIIVGIAYIMLIAYIAGVIFATCFLIIKSIINKIIKLIINRINGKS